MSLTPLLSESEINELIDAAISHFSHRPVNTRFSLLAGDQSSQQIGEGLDFADRRAYSTGDDPRLIDWRASARSSQLISKQFYREILSSECIIIDRSDSLFYGTRTRLKITQSIRCATILGAQAIKDSIPLCCLLIDKDLFWQPSSRQLSHFRSTLIKASRSRIPDSSPVSSNWDKALAKVVRHLPFGSQLTLISDFFSMTRSVLNTLAKRYRLKLIFIYDPSEYHWKPELLSRLSWGNNSISIDSEETMHNFNLLQQKKMQQINNMLTSVPAEYLKFDCQDQLIESLVSVRV